MYALGPLKVGSPFLRDARCSRLHAALSLGSGRAFFRRSGLLRSAFPERSPTSITSSSVSAGTSVVATWRTRFPLLASARTVLTIRLRFSMGVRIAGGIEQRGRDCSARQRT